MLDMVSCAAVLPHSQKQLLETQLPREKKQQSVQGLSSSLGPLLGQTSDITMSHSLLTR